MPIQGYKADVSKLQVFGPYYLVRKSPERKTSGGVDLPDSVAESANRCEVVVVGDGKARGQAATFSAVDQVVEMPLKVGDIVIVEPRMLMGLVYEGEQFFRVEIDGILAKLP